MKDDEPKKFGPYATFKEAKEDFKRMMQKDNYRSREHELITKRMYWAYVDGYMVEQFPKLPDGPYPTFWGVRLDPTPDVKGGDVVFLYVPAAFDVKRGRTEIIENNQYHK